MESSRGGEPERCPSATIVAMSSPQLRRQDRQLAEAEARELIERDEP
jgi:hypothetical protein